jgi:hypothetical protein
MEATTIKVIEKEWNHCYQRGEEMGTGRLLSTGTRRMSSGDSLVTLYTSNVPTEYITQSYCTRKSCVR